MQVWVCFPRYRWYDKKWQGCDGVKGHQQCGWFSLVEVVDDGN